MSKSATRLLIGQATTLLSTINLQFGTTSNLLGQYLLTIQKQQQEHMPTELIVKENVVHHSEAPQLPKKRKRQMPYSLGGVILCQCDCQTLNGVT